jgi:hypothetical protein
MRRFWDVARELVAVTIVATVVVEEEGGQNDATQQIVEAVKAFKEFAIQQGHYNPSRCLDIAYSDIVLNWLVQLAKRWQTRE